MIPQYQRPSVGAQGRALLPDITLFRIIGFSACCATVLLGGLACVNGGPTALPENTREVRGHIVEVIPRSITEVETLRIRDESGRELTFASEGFAGFTPSHLREHQLFGLPVLVFYIERDGRLIAVDIKD